MTRHSRLTLSAVTFIAVVSVLPTEALAQRRAVRRPAGRPVVYVAARPYYYYRPVYFSPFFGYYGGYGAWYGGYPFHYYGHYPPYGWHYRDYNGSARIQVQPRHAEVFIDGYFVGTVDDFDGWLQRLHVAPGEHELEIYLPGHQPFRQQVLFRPGATLRIEHVMQPLAAGEPEAPRPTPSQGTVGRTAGPPPRRAGEMPPRVDVPARDRDVEPREYGAIAVRVQPADAEVLVDGEAWQSPEAGSITLQLAEGSHRVEVRRSGYRTYSADVRVRRGETTTLNVSLSKL